MEASSRIKARMIMPLGMGLWLGGVAALLTSPFASWLRIEVRAVFALLAVLGLLSPFVLGRKRPCLLLEGITVAAVAGLVLGFALYLPSGISPRYVFESALRLGAWAALFGIAGVFLRSRWH